MGHAAGITSEALLERSAELARIDACFEELRGGNGRLMVFEGRPGIGKTGLLLAARERARAAGMQALSARGSEIERDLAWGLVRQLFEARLRAAAQGDRERLLAGAASLAAPLLSVAREPTTSAGSTPEDRSFSVLHGLHWLTVNLADEAPLVLVVDDAHWADVASLRFLGYLARRLDGLPVGILLAARPDTDVADDLLVQLMSDPVTEALRPQPLSVAAAGELLHGVLGNQPERAFAAACHVATGGLPFLLNELARDLREKAVEPVDSRLDDVHTLGPLSIARNIRARVQQLGSAAVRLAQAVAILGPGSELRHAATIAELDVETASMAADGLAAAGIIEDGRPLTFVHAIVSRAIARELRAGDRARLHSQAAQLFASEQTSRERVASHLLATDPGGSAWVVDTLHRAAHDALGQGAPRSASAYLKRALAEPPEPELRSAILRDLGFAESYARDASAVPHLQEALLRARDTSELVGTTMAFGRMLQLAGQHALATGVYERTLERLAGDDPAVVLKVEGALVAAALLDRSTAATASRRLPRLRERAEELPNAPFTVFGPLSLAAAGANERADSVAALARRALVPNQPLLPEAPDRPPFFYYASTALMLAEAFDEAQALLDRTVEDAQRLASLPHYVGLSAFRSWLNQRRGALADAEADARIALSADSEAPAFFTCVARAVLVDVLAEREEFDEAERVCGGVAQGSGAETNITYGILLGAMGRLRLARNQPVEALDHLRSAERHMAAFRFGSPAVVSWRSDAAITHLALGEAEIPARLAGEEVELARAFGVPRVTGCALRAAGLVRGGDAGIALLREAVEQLSESGAPLEHARALTDLGAALRRRGRRVEARAPLRSGLELAHRCQATALSKRAHAELVATGARPRRLVVFGVDALTPSERRVAQMAAAGHTNREIAQALFVTARTVEGHLTHIFQKLQISARTELSEHLGGTDERR